MAARRWRLRPGGRLRSFYAWQESAPSQRNITNLQVSNWCYRPEVEVHTCTTSGRYRRTRNLRTVRLLLEHSKLEPAVKYLSIEVDDALEISEQTKI